MHNTKMALGEAESERGGKENIAYIRISFYLCDAER